MISMHLIGVARGLSWADRLTISRVVCAPMLLTGAIADAAAPFGAVAVFGVLSDIADGPIARAAATASPRGAQLDSLADLTFYPAVLIGLVLLFPAQFRAESGPLLTVLAAYAIPILIGWCKFGALTAYHTILARIALGVVPASAVLWLSTGVTTPLYWGIALLVLSAVEEVLITLRLRAARVNIPHLFALPHDTISSQRAR
jgi:cardiolipin synthase